MALRPSPTLRTLWRRLGLEFGTLTGMGVELAPRPTLSRRPVADPGRYYAQLELVEPTKCTFYIAFDVPLAIVFSGKLMMMQNPAIKHKVSARTFEGDDIDGMGECVNTLCSSITDVLRNELGAAHRVVFRAGGLEAPDFGPLGPTIMARGKLGLQDLATGEIAVYIPKALFPAAQGDDDEGDEDEDGEDEDDDDDDDDGEDDEDDSRSRKSAKSARKKRKGGNAGRDAAGRSAAGVDLSADELAALREATQDALATTNVFVVAPQKLAYTEWVSAADGATDVTIVRSVPELLRMSRQREPGCIVVDADACPCGGVGVLAALRSVTAPCYIVASHPTMSHLVTCLSAGAREYFPKPIALTTLMEMAAEAARSA